MKVVVQRCLSSNVKVDGNIVGSINKGLNVLVGFTSGDTLNDIEYITKKIVNLRIFDDESGVMNKSILDINGQVLLISQFTLYANPYKGNRPNYIDALNGNEAVILYDLFTKSLKKYVPVETGIFGSDMKVEILNDGPVTIIIDSKKN